MYVVVSVISVAVAEVTAVVLDVAVVVTVIHCCCGGSSCSSCKID